MPSTYTVNLGIEKPATGEQSGTWGETTNVNFDLLDQAVNGAERVTLTSAGSSGSPNSLQITNGSTSDGRNKWLEFYSSSDLGGSAFVQLEPNDAKKIVFVRNSLASSQSVILFQGTYNSARDLEVPAGVDMVVKFDGGGASAATVTDVFTKLRATEITTPTLTASTADINGGSIDGTNIGASNAGTGSFTTLNASSTIKGESSTGGFITLKRDDTTLTNNADVGVIHFETTDTDDAGVASTILASGDGALGGVKLRFYAGFASNKTERLTLYSAGETVFNENGLDFDFRIESNNNSTMLFVDGGNDRVSVGHNQPAKLFDVSSVTGSSSINPTETVISTRTNANDWAIGSSNQWGILGFYKTDNSGGGAGNIATIGASMQDSIGSFGNVHFQLANPLNSYATDAWLTLQNSSNPNDQQVIVSASGGLQVNGGAVFNEDGANEDFRVESDNNSSALFVDAAEDNILLGRTSAQSYESTLSTINVEATGSFSTSAVVKTGVGATYVNSGWTFINSRQVWLITLVGNNTTSNAHSTVAYIATVGSHSKTLVQLGNASDHLGNGFLSAQLDSSSSPSVNLQVRWNSLPSGGTSDVTVQGLRLL